MAGNDDVAPEILGHYAAFEERDRLAAGDGLLEKLRTQEILRRHLPAPPAVVLDVGGGPGVYALWLADLGYEVHLVDVVPGHVAEAAAASTLVARPLASASVGDARHLARQDASVDAVLFLGPLYHLPESVQRRQALGEARRVLRAGGMVFAAAISRFASTIDGYQRGFVDDPAFRKVMAAGLETGVHRNPTGRIDYFTTAYFHHPDDLRREIVEAGFTEVNVLAVESIGWVAPDLDARLRDDTERERLLGLVRRIETEPSLLGASPHLLGIGRAG